MATLRHEIRIDADAETVWTVVGRPEILCLWFPGIVASVVEGNTRTITTGAGIPMPEEIITNDSLQRRFQYRINAPLFTFHLATVDVLDVGDGTCMVVYSTDAEPAVMALVISGGTLGALEELHRQFTAGRGPALAAVGIGDAATEELPLSRTIVPGTTVEASI